MGGYGAKGMLVRAGSETNEQIALANWLKSTYPALLWSASAGGMRTSIGTAKKMKAMGYSRGFPDIFIYEPRGNFHGLAIELKKEKGKVTPEQKYWILELSKRGYYALVCFGSVQARDVIEKYLENNPPKQFLKMADRGQKRAGDCNLSLYNENLLKLLDYIAEKQKLKLFEDKQKKERDEINLKYFIQEEVSGSSSSDCQSGEK